MGVSTTMYTVFGVKIQFDSDFIDQAEADGVYHTLEKYIIADGMGGEYIVVGKVLFDSGDMRWDAPEGFEEIDVTALEDGRAEVVAAFNEHLPDRRGILDQPWKLFSFVHYS